MKTTEKQENFCQEYILNGGNATKAYKTAYNWTGLETTAECNSSKMMKHTKIIQRLGELRALKTEEFVFTKEKAFKEYEEIKEGAKGDKQYSSAKGAVDSQCKLFGLLIEKSESKGTKDINVNMTFSNSELSIVRDYIEKKLEED